MQRAHAAASAGACAPRRFAVGVPRCCAARRSLCAPRAAQEARRRAELHEQQLRDELEREAHKRRRRARDDELLLALCAEEEEMARLSSAEDAALARLRRTWDKADLEEAMANVAHAAAQAGVHLTRTQLQERAQEHVDALVAMRDPSARARCAAAQLEAGSNAGGHKQHMAEGHAAPTDGGGENGGNAPCGNGEATAHALLHAAAAASCARLADESMMRLASGPAPAVRPSAAQAGGNGSVPVKRDGGPLADPSAARQHGGMPLASTAQSGRAHATPALIVADGRAQLLP